VLLFHLLCLSALVMAPSKAVAGGKRKEVSRAAAVAKKQKKEAWGNIANAIGQANIPEEAKTLFFDVLPLSLGEYADKRHAYQERVVDAVGNVLKDMESGLIQDVSSAQSELDAAERKKASLDVSVIETAKNLDAKTLEGQALKRHLASEAIAFRHAKEVLQETDLARQRDAAEAQVAQAKRKEFSTMLEQLEFLTEASPEEPDAQAKNAALLALVKKHAFEDSMLIALPSALRKPKETRGQFDKLTIDGLHLELTKRIAEQDSIIMTHAPTDAKHIASVETAQGALNEAITKLRASAKTFQAAHDELMAATTAEHDAKKAVRDLANTSKRLNKALSSAAAELEIFRSGPVETFNDLRQTTEPKPEAMEQAASVEIVEPVCAC
jgi:chromosome segregation ATPase